jgi:hypothetical protein
MPERIPIRLFVTQFILRAFYVLLTIMRTIFVAIIWLVVVPYTALWIWRFYFWSGENIVINHRMNMPPADNTTMQEPTGNQTQPELTQLERSVRQVKFATPNILLKLLIVNCTDILWLIVCKDN